MKKTVHSFFWSIFWLAASVVFTSDIAIASVEDRCLEIENHLFTLHMNGHELSDSTYEEMNVKLKWLYLSTCPSAEEDAQSFENDWVGEGAGDGDDDEAMGETAEGSRQGHYRSGVARIVQPFKARHQVCASGCTYVSWGIWGDAKHKRRRSCHNSGDAIDIHAIRCGSRVYGPRTARFQSYVGCMRGQFKVIFGNSKHKNHAHIQLHNCRKI